MKLLEVKNLRVQFDLGGIALEVCSEVSFTLSRGKVLGIIGESGSGKTVTSKAILGLLPENAQVFADHIIFKGVDTLAMPSGDFDALRGSEIAMIFQDPVGSFNPVKTIGWHFRHVGKRRKGAALSRREISDEAQATLTRVDIANAESILKKYPHQLSGGMLQRCLIALVLFMKPSMIIADEPTTNLDNLVEHQIIDLFDKLRIEIDAGFIFITHDMIIAERICDEIAVMYAGQIVEFGSASKLMKTPKHPYTRGLVQTARELETRVEELTEIRGEITKQSWASEQCRFGSRCLYHDSQCDSRVTLNRIEGHGEVRCIRVESIEDMT